MGSYPSAEKQSNQYQMWDSRGAVAAVNQLFKKCARFYHVTCEDVPLPKRIITLILVHRLVYSGGSCYRGLTITRTKMIAEVGSDCVMSVQKLFFTILTTYYSHLNRRSV